MKDWLSTKVLTLKIEENVQGRDIFVGDIHGHYEEFFKGLEKLEFDIEKDRVFAVGDLVDRGPDSLKCLRLLKERWFFSCLGNHEQHFYKKQVTGNKVINITTRWQQNLTDEEVDECLRLIGTMPIAISIEKGSSFVGVVHAGVPFRYGWDEFNELLEAYDTETIKFAIYDRNIVHQQQEIEGVDYVFVGHQGLEKVAWFGNQVCIDTAVFVEPWPGETYGLTFAWLENSEPKFLQIRS